MDRNRNVCMKLKVDNRLQTRSGCVRRSSSWKPLYFYPFYTFLILLFLLLFLNKTKKGTPDQSNNIVLWVCTFYVKNNNTIVILPPFFHKLRSCTFFIFFFLGCVLDPVGVSDSSVISDQRFSASSSLSGRSPSDGRLNGSNAWIPATNNDNNDFLQIDLGSVYFVCGVATQGNPANNHWTKTYKIKTSLDNVVWTFYSEGGSEKVHSF